MPRRRAQIGLAIVSRENIGGLILALVVAAIIGLLVYNFVAGPGQKGPTQPEAPAQEQRLGPGGEVILPTTHTVARGEHLSSISTRYYKRGDLWPALAKANNIANPSVIEPETKLTIPKLEEAQTVKLSDIVQKSKEKITGSIYTVQRGDTLWDIAERAYGNGFLWTKIDQSNSLGRLPNGRPLIHTGNTLTVPR